MLQNFPWKLVTSLVGPPPQIGVKYKNRKSVVREEGFLSGKPFLSYFNEAMNLL